MVLVKIGKQLLDWTPVIMVLAKLQEKKLRNIATKL